MKRLLATATSLAAACALVFGLSGCNVELSGYAAVVNGSQISQQQLRNVLGAIVANSSYRCTIKADGTKQLFGAGQGTYSAKFSDEVLSILIQDRVIHQQVIRLGLAEPAAVKSAALAQLQEASTPATKCSGTGASLVAAFSASYRRQLLTLQVDEDALGAYMDGTSLRASALKGFVARHKALMELNCVSVIEVSAERTAETLKSRLANGDSFGALARASSIDSTTASEGGVLGCIPDWEFSSPLNKVIAAVALGGVSAPVKFDSDWLLLKVTQRGQQDYAQVVAGVVAQENNALSELVTRLLRKASVQVDPQFGTWERTSSLARVTPNEGPPSDIVPNAAANKRSSVSS